MSKVLAAATFFSFGLLVLLILFVTMKLLLAAHRESDRAQDRGDSDGDGDGDGDGDDFYLPVRTPDWTPTVRVWTPGNDSDGECEHDTGQGNQCWKCGVVVDRMPW